MSYARRLAVVVLAVMGCVGESAADDHTVLIRKRTDPSTNQTTCWVNADKLSVWRQDVETVKWKIKSHSPKKGSVTVQFIGATPCKEGPTFTVTHPNSSGVCTIDAQTTPNAYKYALFEGTNKCADPSVEVNDSRLEPGEQKPTPKKLGSPKAGD